MSLLPYVSPLRWCIFAVFSCGSGLSGEALTEHGHFWVGMDISKPMLGRYKKDKHLLQMW